MAFVELPDGSLGAFEAERFVSENRLVWTQSSPCNWDHKQDSHVPTRKLLHA
jgi:hypothetical protein